MAAGSRRVGPTPPGPGPPFSLGGAERRFGALRAQEAVLCEGLRGDRVLAAPSPEALGGRRGPLSVAQNVALI